MGSGSGWEPWVLGRADAFLAWLRVAVEPTVTRAELLFTPLIVVGLLCHLRNLVVMWRLQGRLRRDGLETDLGASARERSRRSAFGVARLACWAAICWVLLVNWPYAPAVFTVGVLLYGALEAIDAGMDWVYQAGRERYWQRRTEREDYAEQVALRAERAVERAERAALLAAEQAARIEAALTENTALTREAKAKASDAYEEANTVNRKIASLGEHLTAERQQERLAQELPRHGESGGTET